MARKVDYIKKIEKIKLQLDELSNAINLNQTDYNSDEAPVIQKIKASDIDFEKEDIQSLLKIQSKISRAISKKIKAQ